MASQQFNKPEFKLLPILDEQQDCPYIDGQRARMPLLWATERIQGNVLDSLFGSGHRRSGVFFYYTACPNCCACEPTRIEVNRFRWSRSMRRVLQKGDREFQISWESPADTEERVELFNLHRITRGLNKAESPMTRFEVSSFLVESSCVTRDLAIRQNDRLIAVSVTDLGEESLSAVYCYFDPEFSSFSVGTYAILKQIQFALETGRKYLYLGMYVASNQHLKYKARFVPQQRFIHGRWTDFDDPPTAT